MFVAGNLVVLVRMSCFSCCFFRASFVRSLHLKKNSKWLESNMITKSLIMRKMMQMNYLLGKMITNVIFIPWQYFYQGFCPLSLLPPTGSLAWWRIRPPTKSLAISSVHLRFCTHQLLPTSSLSLFTALCLCALFATSSSFKHVYLIQELNLIIFYTTMKKIDLFYIWDMDFIFSQIWCHIHDKTWYLPYITLVL